MFNFNDLLSADEFELFCRDILSAKFALDLKTFAPGPDRGIDIKYSFTCNGDDWIGQCKNYKSLGIDTIEKEFDKVEKINPKRYFFMTSVDLTDSKIDKIYNIFKKYMKSTDDIFGKKELNKLLEDYPYILKKYYQLWIGSSNLLQSFLYAEDENCSEIKYNEILSDIKTFIYTSYYEEVKEVLEKEHYCIIEGLPGTGKTTLSSVLLLSYMKDKPNCKFVYVKEIKDISKYMNPNEEVVFLFDDFLGDYLYDPLRLNEKSIQMLISIIALIKKSDNKRMLLTTRKNIINKAKLENYKMKDNIFNNIITLEMEKLTLDDKKKIVSSSVEIFLKNSAVHSFWTTSFINKIAKHKNFYPRLLTEVLKINLIISDNERDYQYKVVAYFDNCEKIWEEVFRNKLSHEAKLLCYQIIFDKEQTYFKVSSNFSKRYNAIYYNFCKKHNLEAKIIPYRDSLIETEGFVTNGSFENLAFYDNSIKDYLYYFLNKYPEQLSFYFIENKILESPLMSKVLMQFSFSQYGRKINLTPIQDEIITILEENIKYYTLNDLYIIFRIQRSLMVLLSSDIIKEYIYQILPDYQVDCVESFSFYNLEIYLRITKAIKYKINDDVILKIIEVCKESLVNGNIDLSDLESLILFAITYDCIEEFDDTLISRIIDNEFRYKDFHDLYDLEEIVESCEPIAKYFDISNCVIVNEIKDALDILQKNEKVWEEYEDIAFSLENIFSF